MALNFDDTFDDIGSGGSITDAPAGHGIRFGETVNSDGSVADFRRNGGDAEVFGATIDQLFIDLIRDDEKSCATAIRARHRRLSSL